ncbi:hypothetical protein DL89DRAFT_291363 [Linderina pennispora]|uniref:Pyridoxamine 5'-phosphate oxidase Alr4036 family FMN-binding domain-containing protein n=1 Tax=Linderina pennispora TaxID=61395 RepID=A0A1Y1WFX8_9FUNG|nr:uncharacterized protein DL89DRAFT_291363 [Linderina pennispora]ORX72136.1 hypothetical protein DL89DRAFT_291363 [Linderina pennispora]
MGQLSIVETSSDPEWKKAFNRHLALELESPQKFATCVLSTVDGNGHPAARLVTPRGFVGEDFLRLSPQDGGQWTSDVMTFCTHSKSIKVQELVGVSDVQLLYWFPHAQVQVRCSGQAHMLFHPDNPHYSTLSLDIRQRIWRRDEREAGLDNSEVELDTEYIREQAFLNHSPVIQAWYSWPPPGRVRSGDASLYPQEIPGIKDEEMREKYGNEARRNYVLVFVDVTKVDIVDLKDNTRKLYKRRGDTTWTVTNINP